MDTIVPMLIVSHRMPNKSSYLSSLRLLTAVVITSHSHWCGLGALPTPIDSHTKHFKWRHNVHNLLLASLSWLHVIQIRKVLTRWNKMHKTCLSMNVQWNGSVLIKSGMLLCYLNRQNNLIELHRLNHSKRLEGITSLTQYHWCH